MRKGWTPAVIIALAAAILLLAAGVAMAFYEENLYAEQQVKSVREQAQILAASAGAAIVFEDKAAAQEYVNALQVNPEIQAAGIYGQDGQLLAGFARGGAPLSRRAPLTEGTVYAAGHIEVTAAASQKDQVTGATMLRAVAEPLKRRLARYAGLILLVTMGALVIGVLSFSQAALTRRATELAAVNVQLHREMQERQRTEEALRQSSKMEAVGQLSGGIAHDFNNLIMIVKGNLRLLRRKLGQENEPPLTYVAAADEALERAAHLTQRILAFSRRQPLTPQNVDLGTLIRGMGELIRHSAGEGVQIVTALNASWPVLCDVNQMENVILNLAINARDAMPEGGTLTIETADRAMTAPPPDTEAENFIPGDYVVLSMRDTGMGMPEEVRRRALDPFFTTKPQGKGTGLGLSMTFGFVRQSGGHLVIESRPGHGTVVTIFMPRLKEDGLP